MCTLQLIGVTCPIRSSINYYIVRVTQHLSKCNSFELLDKSFCQNFTNLVKKNSVLVKSIYVYYVQVTYQFKSRHTTCLTPHYHNEIRKCKDTYVTSTHKSSTSHYGERK